jgi:2,4-dienoyl-CoA reductase (NADPH2)
VTLIAKESKIGGLLPTAALIKGTKIEDLVAFIRYFKTQLDKLGVTVILGRKVDCAVVGQMKPDAVILATGSVPATLHIPGINNGNIIQAAALHDKLKIWQKFLGPNVLGFLTKIWMPIGKTAIIIGGAMQGCELAEFLTLRGRKVIVVEQAEQAGLGMGSEKMSRLFKWMALKGVTTITGVKTYKKLTDKGLVIQNKNGEEEILKADTYISVLPASSNTDLFNELKGKIPELYNIGDCKDPGLIADAVADGAKVARMI